MKKILKKRPVINGCDVEGMILDNARIQKKQTDKRFTQAYVAGLVNQDQGIWTQWREGTTRILDSYWIRFSLALDFDPFQTRPQLREMSSLILQAEAKYFYSGKDDAFVSMFHQIDDETKKMLMDLMSRMSSK